MQPALRIAPVINMPREGGRRRQGRTRNMKHCDIVASLIGGALHFAISIPLSDCLAVSFLFSLREVLIGYDQIYRYVKKAK